MAVGITRTYFGGVVGRHGLMTAVPSSSGSVVASACYAHRNLTFPTRAYASASPSTKRKRAGKGKGAIKDALTNGANTIQEPAKPAKPKAKDASVEPEEENLKKLAEIDRIMAFQHLMPTFDPWGQAIQETLDVTVPPTLTFGLATQPKKLLSVLRDRTGNSLKNWSALSMLAGQNAIPGQDLNNLSWWRQIGTVTKCFGAQSTSSNALVAPLRDIALESYVELNTALANRSLKDINRLTTSKYNEHIVGLSKTSKAKLPSGRLIWQMHKTFEPVRIVSLRATEGYMAPTPPRNGHRFMIHAIVKFDTEQSLEMYNERGAALHVPAANPPPHPEGTDKWRVPAERRRVTEYLVIEKKGWTQVPWQFREQIW